MKCPNKHTVTAEDKVLAAIFGGDAERQDMRVAISTPSAEVLVCDRCGYKTTIAKGKVIVA